MVRDKRKAEPAFDLRRRIGKWSSECTANARCPDLPPCGPAANLPGWTREGRITLIHVKLMSDGHRLNRAFFAFTIDLIQRRRRDAPAVGGGTPLREARIIVGGPIERALHNDERCSCLDNLAEGHHSRARWLPGPVSASV